MAVQYLSAILAQFDTNIALVTNASTRSGGFTVAGYRFPLDKEPDSALDGAYYLEAISVAPRERFWGTGENISEAIVSVRVAYYRGGGDAGQGDRQSVLRNAADDCQRLADVLENPANYNPNTTGVRVVRYQGSTRIADMPRAEIWESRFSVEWRSDVSVTAVIP